MCTDKRFFKNAGREIKSTSATADNYLVRLDESLEA